MKNKTRVCLKSNKQSTEVEGSVFEAIHTRSAVKQQLKIEVFKAKLADHGS